MMSKADDECMNKGDIVAKAVGLAGSSLDLAFWLGFSFPCVNGNDNICPHSTILC